MFKLSYTTPHLGEVKTIRLKRDPSWFGMGLYEDEKGSLWDINGVFGSHVWARLYDSREAVYSTSSVSQGYSVTWEPYKVEVVGDEKELRQ